MNDFYSVILDNMCFSYSSVNSFVTCPHMFLLNYLKNEDRVNNFFSDFGLLIHEILEKYFRNELEIFELSQYYENNYASKVISPPPPYPPNMAESYYKNGLNFLNNFSFDKSEYDVISIENKIKTTYIDSELVIKPDIVLKNKETGIVTLMDYKTSNPMKGKKLDEKKIEEYRKQMYLYSYFINHVTDIKINNIKLWFIRFDKWDEFDYNENDAIKVVNWFYNTINKIKQEENFSPADLIKNKYFCDNICSFRNTCKYVN